MSKFSQKGSRMGYQKPTNFGSSSAGSSSFGSRKGKVTSSLTMIKDIEPMLDNITVQGRVISLWHSHRLNEPHNPYSLDFVLQDSQNSRIQVYIKKDFMFKFEPLFEEGRCYSIANFAIAENSDVIGSIVAIGDVVPVQSSGGRKIRRSVVIEDIESNHLECTFWDQWATMFDEYAQKRNELGHVVFILQLGKVKYWNGSPSIHNALFGTKMFINRDVPEILAFRQRVKELPEYDESQFKIELFKPEKPVVTIAEFFHGAMKKMVATIRECEENTHCIVYAKIHQIHKESGWAYTACKQCNKKVEVVTTKATTPGGKNKVTFYCDDDGVVQAKSSFKVIMRIIDDSGSAPIVFFNTVFSKISGYTAWEIMEKNGMDVDSYWPHELDEMVGKRFLFKLYFS